MDELVVGGSGRPLLFSLWSVLPLFLLAAVWLVLAVTVSFRGGDVERQANRIAQLYGYTVCLVAVIVSLMSLYAVLDAAFDRANPLQSDYSFGASLTSFDAYRATYRRETGVFTPGSNPAPDTASETTLRQRYEALVADRRAGIRYRTTKTMTTSSVLLVVALGLFTVHWRWVRRLNGASATAG